jgi:catechol 2,3-dioxygenase-like lactoylglutathione lyase family enzyme
LAGDILRRTTIFVRNAEVSARWYEQVFGWTRWMDTPFTLSGRQLAAGKAGDQTRLILMKAEHDFIGMLGLLQWVDPPMDAPADRPTRIVFGAPVFVVNAVDCAATIARARALGSRIHAEPESWTVNGADGQPIAMIGASLFDPDGYFFEVNQRT